MRRGFCDDPKRTEEDGFAVHEGQEARAVQEAGGNRTSDRALQERLSSGTELLQGSFRRLYKCHARCCRI